MKIFSKQRYDDGRRDIYFLGIKVFSYKKRISKYESIYARRFYGLNEKEMRYCLEQQFIRNAGYKLNLDNPKTFNEKLQWLKLYYHRHPNPLITKCADKVGVRDYVKEKIGGEYLIPCLGVWDNPDDIDFDKLPNRFVLKVNWGSGQNIIVKDKSKLDIADAREKLRDWMKPESNHYYNHFEWGYKDIKPKIIAEKYIEQMDGKLLDYKFFCFDGVPTYCQIDANRFIEHTRCFYNMQLEKQKFKLIYPSYEGKISLPKNFKKMKDIAQILSKGFPFGRVDFFLIGDCIYIGEITFFPEAGFGRFDPPEWDKKLGDLLVLPKEKSNG